MNELDGKASVNELFDSQAEEMMLEFNISRDESHLPVLVLTKNHLETQLKVMISVNHYFIQLVESNRVQVALLSTFLSILS